MSATGFATGLVDVPTTTLVRVLRHVHRGEVRCPLDIGELTRVGAQSHAVILLDVLRAVDEAGVRAVLVSVLAERRAAEARAADARAADARVRRRVR